MNKFKLISKTMGRWLTIISLVILAVRLIIVGRHAHPIAKPVERPMPA